MASPNNLPFWSADGTTDFSFANAAKLFDMHASVSFRSESVLAFNNMLMLDRRSVSNAASFQWYMFGQMPESTDEYRPGDEVLGQDYSLKTGTVNIDPPVLGSFAIGETEQVVAHFNLIPYAAKETGRQAALNLDRRILNQHVQAAQTAAVTDTNTGLTIHNGGIRVTRVGGSTTVSTAMTAAYPLSAAGAANLRADLRALNLLADQNYWDPDYRYILLDIYLRAVLQYDANAVQWASRDYVDGQNNLVTRKIEIIEGWKVLKWVNRVGNKGIIPDTNVTNFTKATKFNANFTPGAGKGYPCVCAFGASKPDDASVGFGTWQGMKNMMMWQEWKHIWLHQTYIYCGIEKMHPWSAGTIEVTNT